MKLYVLKVRNDDGEWETRCASTDRYEVFRQETVFSRELSKHTQIEEQRI